jgi:CHAT domain-containing protein
LLAADRLRAETLNQALGMDDQRTAPTEPAPVPIAPPETDSAVDRVALIVGDIRRDAEGALEVLGVPVPPEWPELSSVLREIGAAALVPQPTVDGLTVFLALPDGEIRAHRSTVSSDELTDLIAAAQAELHVEIATRSAGSNQVSTTADPRRAALDDVLHTLHGALVEPVQDAVEEGCPLVVVPYRDLALVPWSLLLDTAGNHLCELHPLSLLPSLATLAQLRRRRVERSRPQSAYVVGAPTSAPDLALPALPGARAEAEHVAAAVQGTGAASPRLRLAEEATKASYRAEAANADFVHLACHAALRTPAQTSPLFLAASPDDDGVLFAPEIAEIGLSDALVFLSACQTGLGRPTADGVIGLGRAFLEAGARCVVLSLWEVSDASTSALVHHFVGRFLDPGPDRLDAAGALRSAMLATREDLRAGRLTYGRGTALVDHPKNWAPFVVMGDGSFAYRE